MFKFCGLTKLDKFRVTATRSTNMDRDKILLGQFGWTYSIGAKLENLAQMVSELQLQLQFGFSTWHKYGANA